MPGTALCERVRANRRDPKPMIRCFPNPTNLNHRTSGLVRLSDFAQSKALATAATLLGRILSGLSRKAESLYSQFQTKGDHEDSQPARPALSSRDKFSDIH